MNDFVENGAVCGIDGCSAFPTPAPLHQNPDTPPDSLHDLTIVSDVICPWCFVAKRNLDQALAIAGPDFKVKITWQPYELNPGMPQDGMDRRDYRSRKFGSWKYSQALDAQVAEAGQRAGLTFRHDLMKRTPNTFQAHRLIWLAEKEGVQDKMVESLFRAYFTEGRDVGDLSVLVDLAVEAGITEDRARAFLQSFDGETLFSGAVKPALLAARLREAAASHGKE